jgi:hypothetical protein
MIITASVGIEPRKKVPYFPLVEEALEIAKTKEVFNTQIILLTLTI